MARLGTRAASAALPPVWSLPRPSAIRAAVRAIRARAPSGEVGVPVAVGGEHGHELGACRLHRRLDCISVAGVHDDSLACRTRPPASSVTVRPCACSRMRVSLCHTGAVVDDQVRVVVLAVRHRHDRHACADRMAACPHARSTGSAGGTTWLRGSTGKRYRRAVSRSSSSARGPFRLRGSRGGTGSTRPATCTRCTRPRRPPAATASPSPPARPPPPSPPTPATQATSA